MQLYANGIPYEVDFGRQVACKSVGETTVGFYELKPEDPDAIHCEYGTSVVRGLNESVKIRRSELPRILAELETAARKAGRSDQ